MDYVKPTVQLIGNDGNAFSILGNVRRALKEAGASPDTISEFTAKATEGDYNHLLRTCMEYVNVE